MALDVPNHPGDMEISNDAYEASSLQESEPIHRAETVKNETTEDVSIVKSKPTLATIPNELILKIFEQFEGQRNRSLHDEDKNIADVLAFTLTCRKFYNLTLAAIKDHLSTYRSYQGGHLFPATTRVIGEFLGSAYRAPQWFESGVVHELSRVGHGDVGFLKREIYGDSFDATEHALYVSIQCHRFWESLAEEFIRKHGKSAGLPLLVPHPHGMGLLNWCREVEQKFTSEHAQDQLASMLKGQLSKQGDWLLCLRHLAIRKVKLGEPTKPKTNRWALLQKSEIQPWIERAVSDIVRFAKACLAADLGGKRYTASDSSSLLG